MASTETANIWLPRALAAQSYPSRIKLYFAAICIWVSIIVIGGLISAYVPFMHYSLWTLCFGGFGSKGPAGSAGPSWPYLVFIALIFVLLARPGRLKKAAEREEIAYRKGAEHWTNGQRAWSCVRFGFIHVWNIVIPFGFVIALMFGGAYLMIVYLRAYRRTHIQSYAVEVATRAHAAINMVALTVISLALASLVLGYI